MILHSSCSVCPLRGCWLRIKSPSVRFLLLRFIYAVDRGKMAKNIDAHAELLAALGPKPTMLYHLKKENGKYVLGHKIPVSEGYKASDLPLSYNELDADVRDVISSLVWDANGNNPDLTKHPWALHSIWKLQASKGLAVILEWQPASAVPRTSVVGGNATPVASSSTFMFASSRSSGSSMTEADETSSILYVIPKVDDT